jgi:MerR family Zn(II)-responsive transcriptional regulator of zntA
MMRIGELAQRTGLTPDTIRFYEKQGLVDASLYQRHANNYRMYHDAAVDRLLLIKQAKRFGFTLTELRHLGQQWQTQDLSRTDKMKILTEKLHQIEQHMQELEHIKKYVAEKLAGLQAATKDNQR